MKSEIEAKRKELEEHKEYFANRAKLEGFNLGVELASKDKFSMAKKQYEQGKQDAQKEFLGKVLSYLKSVGFIPCYKLPESGINKCSLCKNRLEELKQLYKKSLNKLIETNGKTTLNKKEGEKHEN